MRDSHENQHDGLAHVVAHAITVWNVIYSALQYRMSFTLFNNPAFGTGPRIIGTTGAVNPILLSGTTPLTSAQSGLLNGLMQYVSVDSNNHNITVGGANLQVTNGTTGSMAYSGHTVNGLGNIILGFNESSMPPNPAVTRTGSHNLVIGTGNEYTSHHCIVGGWNSKVTHTRSSVISGYMNEASGPSTCVISGVYNRATANNSVVLGGEENETVGSGVVGAINSVIVGGNRNIATGAATSLLGGNRNEVAGKNATIAGGAKNVCGGVAATLIGGEENISTANYAAAVGGTQLKADGEHCVTLGGRRNKATGTSSVIVGGMNSGSGGFYAATLGGLANFTLGEGSVAVGSQELEIQTEWGVISGGTVMSQSVFPDTDNLSTRQSGMLLITTSSPEYQLPPCSSVRGHKFTFIIGVGETSAAWSVAAGDKLYASLQGGDTQLALNPMIPGMITMGTAYGAIDDATQGDVLHLRSTGTEWIARGISKANAFMHMQPWTLGVHTNFSASATDDNDLLQHVENMHSVPNAWGWNATTAMDILGYTPNSFNVLVSGNPNSFGNDSPTTTVSANDGRTYNSHIPAFLDPLAPSYTGTTNLRVIDLRSPKDIAYAHAASMQPPIDPIRIQSAHIESITVVFRVGDNSGNGDQPDMFTGIQWGKLTAPENLWIEFFDGEGEINDSLPTLTSREYSNEYHNSSHLEALWETKAPLHYKQTTYATLQNSPAYLYMRDGGINFTNATFPLGLHWHAGTTQSLASLATAQGWNTVPSVSQGGDGINTFYDLVYGNAISHSFLYNGNADPQVSGIIGAANVSASLWDPSQSLAAQPLLNRSANADLVTGGVFDASFSDQSAPEHGGVHRDLNLSSARWIKKTIRNIPRHATHCRIFQDRYTGGGVPSNDSYAIADIEVSLRGSYV